MQRITNSILVSNYLNSMKRNLNNLSTFQNQLSSGKNIQRASQDPYVATKLMKLNAEITANKQYNTNITDTSNWLDVTDTALAQAGNIFTRIRELMVKAGNGAYGPDQIETIQKEVTENVNQLGQVLNTSFNGSYVFGGTKTTSKPVIVDANGNISYADKNGVAMNYTVSTNASASFPAGTVINDCDGAKSRIAELDAIIASGTSTAAQISDAQNEKTALAPFAQIDSDLKSEVAEGVVINYNKTASDILEFTYTDTSTFPTTTQKVNTSDVLSDIINNLKIASGTDATAAKTAISEITGDNLNQIDQIAKNLLLCRSSVGALQNRMDAAKQNNEADNENMTEILSQVGDVDYAEKTMEYSVAQTSYTASLQTSAKVLTKTLLDYL